MPDRTNEEGGSHEEGRIRRMSSTADDMLNVREKYDKTSCVMERAPAEKKGFAVKMKECFGCPDYPKPPIEDVDVLLVGGGIMSITVGLMLKDLEPNWKIVCYERLGTVAEESSNGWNNAGTGHSALCEPNYTPTKGETVDVTKAITVNENWQLSRQYWAYLVREGVVTDTEWINVTPHITFGHGDDQLKWAQARFDVLSKHPLFKGIEHTTDHAKMRQWCPVMMEGRKADDKCSMTMVPYGTDVDFGALTKEMSKGFLKRGGDINLFHTVTALKQQGDKSWVATVASDDLGAGARQVRSKFVFVGAGGWALLLLQKSGIKEARGFMGFPISGEFLVCQNKDVAERHVAKVYGKAAIGAPPMSVPHLDSRIIGGKKMILFGPFAGFSPRYLKTGSLLDLIKAVRPHNLIPAAAAGLQNLDLTIYLVKQLLATKAEKLEQLKVFMPEARPEDWTLSTAGQRVQIMKSDPKKMGILQFGTEVVAAEDGSICGLLGASPGASTAVQVAIDVLNQCFKSKVKNWEPKLKTMVPSHGKRLSDDPALAERLHKETASVLGIK